jgi:phosphatidate cytidylyltransferase
LKSNFKQRVITSIIFVVVLVGGTILHSSILFVIFSAIVVIGMLEFYKIAAKAQHKPHVVIGIIFGLYVLTSNFLIAANLAGKIIYFSYIPFASLFLIIELFKQNKNPFSNVAITLIGIIYISMPFGLLSYLVFYPPFGDTYNPSFLIAYFLLMWANDSGAYIVGSLIGKHKLFERISPKKTWEGFIGGAFFTLLAAWGISLYLHELSLIHWLMVGTITFSFGTFGDLIESQLKRSVDMKDSGKILPGHGGILDRFDSILFSAPIVFVYLMFFYEYLNL